jgi:hypothetical protein
MSLLKFFQTARSIHFQELSTANTFSTMTKDQHSSYEYVFAQNYLNLYSITSNKNLAKLPTEIIQIILSNLTIKDAVRFSAADKQFLILIRSTLLDQQKRYDSREQDSNISSLNFLLCRKRCSLESISIVRSGIGVDTLTDYTLKTISKTPTSHSLRSFTLRGCEQLSDNGFKAIGDRCNKLILLSMPILSNVHQMVD